MAIASIIALKQVVSRHECAPLDDVVKAINIKLRLADQNQNEAKIHRAEAGDMLTALRLRVENDGREWWRFAKDHFDRTRKELEQLMRHVPKSAVAKAAIEINPAMSDRAIAETVGVSKDTIRRARDQLAQDEPVEKRVGKDGKARKMPEQLAIASRSMAEPSKIDPKEIEQAGAFHIELMQYTENYCTRVMSWRATNEIDDEDHDCVVRALEMAAMRLQRAAQDLGGH
ncbi:hypothetical protein [Bradyrhizobium australafricanum]|uniref:hypothetical protein n=1 Tax=Bradyrhizobium australafricanum TaxID=2821406 RepID=UPI001CE3233E|nr:hypothetical protein [Bradyrhizobium australafricanum]MCA6097637.1 hypothetical protein [Bradyrhizobium australafricanum]